MMPVCTQGAADQSCGVVKLEYFVPQTVEVLQFHNEWSLRMDTRITANFEVHNATHGMIAGIWMGTRAQLRQALIHSGLTEVSRCCSRRPWLSCHRVKSPHCLFGRPPFALS